MADPEAEALEFLAVAALPQLDIAAVVSWHRQGMVAVHTRLETLKVASAQLTYLAEMVATHQGRIRRRLIDLRAEEDDAIGGPDFASRVSSMTTRGLAWDERRIQHQTRAIAEVIRRRQAEKILLELDDLADRCRMRSFHIRDERNDLRTQVRAIDIGLQIGEL